MGRNINRIIDECLHPHFPNPIAVTIDAVLHSLYELGRGDDPLRVLERILRYSLPEYLRYFRSTSR